jgi:hypothetical protein
MDNVGKESSPGGVSWSGGVWDYWWHGEVGDSRVRSWPSERGGDRARQSERGKVCVGGELACGAM